MRSLAFFVEMLILLPMITLRPFVGVLVWSWISFMAPHKLLWGPASELPWALITAAALAIGCIIAREPKKFTWNPTTVLIVCFMICITLTSITAMAPNDLVFGKWSPVMKSFLLMLVTSFLLTSKERIHAMIWIMVLSLALLVLGRHLLILWDHSGKRNPDRPGGSPPVGDPEGQPAVLSR